MVTNAAPGVRKYCHWNGFLCQRIKNRVINLIVKNAGEELVAQQNPLKSCPQAQNVVGIVGRF
jgi:hypothetical protein